MKSSPFNNLPLLPIQKEIETYKVLKQSIKANKALARLSGYCALLPNEYILLNSVILKEATISSEIENIVTTQDRLYRALISTALMVDPQTKEVLNYRSAVWVGYNEIKKKKLLTVASIVKIQTELEGNNAGIRKLPGTALVNDTTGEIIYTPPSGEDVINKLLSNLESYINTDDGIDHLVKMAIIHYQFESIHPFYDGNGRTGRIINVLYLVLKGLIDSPILYLSSYINKNKADYYRLLQEVKKNDNWEDWVLFMLRAVETTAEETYSIVTSIIELMDRTMELCRDKLPGTIYSKELIELLFMQPYTKIAYLVDAGIGERRTASKYLKVLEEIGVLESHTFKREKIYVNKELFQLLQS